MFVPFLRFGQITLALRQTVFAGSSYVEILPGAWSLEVTWWFWTDGTINSDCILDTEDDFHSLCLLTSRPLNKQVPGGY